LRNSEGDAEALGEFHLLQEVDVDRSANDEQTVSELGRIRLQENHQSLQDLIRESWSNASVFEHSFDIIHNDAAEGRSIGIFEDFGDSGAFGGFRVSHEHFRGDEFDVGEP
jgi:hypothetical protein